MLFFWFKILHVLAVQSLNFVTCIFNRQIFAPYVRRHRCQSVNEARRRDSTCLYLSNQLSRPSTVTNRLTIIKGLLTVKMVYYAAFGCSNVHKKGCGKSFFTFPKDTVRRKAWPFFGKREAFVPTKNHRLCSDQFTRDQIQRDPAELEQYGYDGARIRLKPDAVPGVPLHINSENEDVV